MKKQISYLDSVHRDGRIWSFSILALMLLYPLVIAITFSAMPDGEGLLMGLIATAPMYWAVGIVETFTYIPMLGAGGSYLSFVTGNISNLKLPCALSAMEKYGAKAGTEEGDIISTISIAVSSITTTIIVFLGVLLMIPLSPVLQNPALDPAFAQMLPALFGALGAVFIAKSWKIAISPIILMLILFIAIPALNAGTVGIMVPVSAVFTLVVSRVMYKKGWLDDKKSAPAPTEE